MNGICMDGIKRILRVIVLLGIIFVGGVLRVAGQPALMVQVMTEVSL